jgi:hypothetical protein
LYERLGEGGAISAVVEDFVADAPRTIGSMRSSPGRISLV